MRWGFPFKSASRSLDLLRVGNSTEGTAQARTWDDRPWFAFFIRAVVVLVPVAFAILASWMVARRWSPPETWAAAAGRFAVLLAVATVTGLIVERIARRFLPFASLLRLALVFPDRAPSRFRTALRAGNSRKIARQIAEGNGFPEGTSEGDAARLIVEMVSALSEHDRLTRGHSERVRAYTSVIGEQLGLSADDQNRLQWAGLIHDVGKLAVPAAILTKPGRLTSEEFDVIKTHPAAGARIAEPMRDFLGPWFGAISEHHERWDGNGYPLGLAGDEISLGARIVSVADTYDVITAARSYKAPLSPAFARQELADNAGSQFDPMVVRTFLNISLGELRKRMWPLSWAAQVPFVGPVVTAPVSQSVAVAITAVATALSAGAVTEAFDVNQPPEAVAMVDPATERDNDVDPQGFPSTTRIEVTSTPPSSSTRPIAVTIPPIADLSATSTTVAAAVTSTIVPSSTEPIATSPVQPTPTVESTPSTQPSQITVPAQSTVPDATVPSSTVPDSTVPSSVAAPPTTAAPTDCERAQDGESSMAGADLVGCDLRGLTLSGWFFGADLTGADLRGATVKESGFDEATFVNANLEGAVLETTAFDRTDFTGANMANVSMSHVNFGDAAMVGVNLSGATGSDFGFDGSDMSGANMSNVDIGPGSIRWADLTGATLDGAAFTMMSIEGTDMSDSSFRNGKIVDTDASNVLFHRVDMTEFVIDEGIYLGASFDSAVLRNGQLTGADMTTTDFTKADLTGLTYANLWSSDATWFETTCPDGQVKSSSCF